MLAETIATVKDLTSHGRRSGNWLTKEQAQALLETPKSGWKGLRDRAILGVFLGCELRLSGSRESKNQKPGYPPKTLSGTCIP